MTTRLWHVPAILALSGACAALVACGRSAQNSAHPSLTALVAPCPAKGGVQVRGYFSVDCARSLTEWPFKLPVLNSQYNAPIFELNAPDESPLNVTYRPKASYPVLLLEIFPKGRVGDVGPPVTTPKGNRVGIGPDGADIAGSWEDGNAFYVLDVDGADTTSNRRLILAIADSTLTGTPLK